MSEFKNMERTGYHIGQKGETGWDNMLSNVNLYNGTVVFPIMLAHFSAPDGLALSLQLSYQSTTDTAVRKDNRTAPSSTVGVGWSLPLASIIVGNPKAKNNYHADFYFVGEGGRYPLYREGAQGAYIAYTSIEHPLWQFHFYREECNGLYSYWQITKEDGSQWKLGGANHNVEQKVAWDNWVGAAAANGGEAFAVGWYLGEITSYNGNKITFTYENVKEAIGDQFYTRALHLIEVKSSHGESAHLFYKEKKTFEYSPDYASEGGQNANQCSYDEMYLDKLTIHNSEKQLLYTQQLEYRFINVMEEESCKKRYLHKVTQIDAQGRSMPPITFDYYDKESDSNAGAMKQMTYPTGAAIHYEYREEELTTNVNSLTTYPPTPDWRAQSIHAMDYVIHKYSRDNRIILKIMHWDNSWQEFEDVELEGISVSEVVDYPAQSFFALTYYSENIHKYCLRVYKRSMYRGKEWDIKEITLEGKDDMPVIACGEDYIAVQSKTQNTLTVYQYIAIKNDWQENVLFAEHKDFQALGGGKGFILGAYYDEASQRIHMQIFYASPTHEWSYGGYYDINQEVNWQLTSPASVWAIGDSEACATFVTVKGDVNAESATVRMRWREEYTIADVEVEIMYQTMEVTNPLLYSVASGNIIGHAQRLYRYIPGTWKSRNLLEPRIGGEYKYAYGTDLALAVERLEGRQYFYALRFDPYQMEWTDEGVPQYDSITGEDYLYCPLIMGNCALLGRSLFLRNGESMWECIYEFPTLARMDSVIADPQGEYYLYQLNGRSGVYKLWLHNGRIQEDLELPDEVLDTKPGNITAGIQSFNTLLSLGQMGRLYALHHKKYLEKPRVAVIASVTLNTGFYEQNYYFDYDMETTRLNGEQAMFMSVKAVPVGKDAPYGWNTYSFFNGTSPETAQTDYPQDDPYSNARSFYSQFAGQIYAIDTYNSEGIRQSQIYNWLKALDPHGFVICQTRTTNRKWRTIYGAEDTWKLTESVTEKEYEPTYYQIRQAMQIGRDADGRPLKYVQSYQYSWEYYPLLKQAHVLNQPVFIQKKEMVSNTFLEATATTYQCDGDKKWRESAHYTWKGTKAPSFPKMNGADWYLTEAISRRNSRGERMEIITANGHYKSNLYDLTDRYLIAEFENASLNEILYCGFEPYERLNQWTPQDGENNIEDRIYTEECFSGTRCLCLNGIDAVNAAIRSMAENEDYIFCCAAKALDISGRNAYIEAEITGDAGSQKLRFELATKSRGWERIYKRIKLVPECGNKTSLQLKFIGPEKGRLLLDAIFVTPLHCQAAARVYTGSMQLQSAQHFNYQIGTQTFYDSLQRPVVTASDTNVMQTCTRSYSSALTGGGGNEEIPDMKMALEFSQPGNWTSFARGQDYMSHWEAQGTWEIADFLLCNRTQNRGTLTLKTATAENFAFFIALEKPHHVFQITSGNVEIYCDNGQGTVYEKGSVLCEFTLSMVDKQEYVLVRIGKRLGFYGGFETVTLCHTQSMGAGQLVFTATGACDISHMGYAPNPTMSVSFMDHTSRPIQDQLVSEDGIIVWETVYSGLMQAAVQTRKILFAEKLWNYRSKFVSAFDWKSGILHGEAAEMFPEAEGYPYVRFDTTKSPQPMQRELGQYGKLLSIHGDSPQNHTMTYYEHAIENSNGLLPKNLQTMTLITEPDGKQRINMMDDFGNETVCIEKGQKGDRETMTIYRYNHHGRVTKILYPNYFTAGEDSQSFIGVVEYDALGNIAGRMEPDSGTVRTVYDWLGRLHYQLDDVNREKGRYVYYLYDAWDREVENGWCEDQWDEDMLRSKAGQGGGRPEQAVCCRRYFYDGDGDDNTLWGKLWKSTTMNDPLDRTADVEESFRYDIYGNVICQVLQVGDYRETRRAQFDLGHRLIREQAGEKDIIRYTYNMQGQTKAIFLNEYPLAEYFYSAEGLLLREIFDPESKKPLDRSYTYNVSQWLTALQDRYLNQTMDYDPLSGRIVHQCFKWEQLPPETSGLIELNVDCTYDFQGRLNAVRYGEADSYSLGIHVPASYDQNGNMLSIDTTNFRYAPSGNQAAEIGQIQYRYDVMGFTTAKKSNYSEEITLTYHPVWQTVQQATWGMHSRQYLQGMNGVAAYRDTDKTTLCMQGQEGSLLMETTTDGQRCVCIKGPNGILAQWKDGRIYYLLKDYQSSVRAVYDGRTICAVYHYAPWGGVMEQSWQSPEAAGLVPIRFTSQLLEPCGFYRFHSRWYDPDSGRFLSMDPEVQYNSPYLYGNCDWINYTDPTGAWSWGSFFASLGTFIAGVGMVVAGVALSVASAGIASPVGAFLAVTGSAFLAGAGISTVVYGVTSMVSNEYSITECAIYAGLGGAFAAVGVGVGMFMPVLSSTMSIVADVGMGFVLGAVDGVVTNGVINVLNDQSFCDNVGMSILIGGSVGAVFGGISGIGRAGSNCRGLRDANNEFVLGSDGQTPHASFFRRKGNLIEDGSHLRYNDSKNVVVEKLDGNIYERWTSQRNMKSSSFKVSDNAYEKAGTFNAFGEGAKYHKLTNDCVSHVATRLTATNLQVPLWARIPTTLRIWASLLGPFQ